MKLACAAIRGMHAVQSNITALSLRRNFILWTGIEPVSIISNPNALKVAILPEKNCRIYLRPLNTWYSEVYEYTYPDYMPNFLVHSTGLDGIFPPNILNFTAYWIWTFVVLWCHLLQATVGRERVLSILRMLLRLGLWTLIERIESGKYPSPLKGRYTEGDGAPPHDIELQDGEFFLYDHPLSMLLQSQTMHS